MFDTTLWRDRLIKIAAFGIPIGVAVLLFMGIVGNRPPPGQTPPAERATTVRVTTLAPTSFTPEAIGYGTVEPARTWSAVAQVAGRVAFVHPDLRRGAILPAGTEIIRISPEDYELAVRQAEADLKSGEARLRELEAQAANVQRSLEIEQRSLTLNRDDLERKRTLRGRGVVSEAALDEAERGLLTQQAKVQDLENQITLFPPQIDAQRQSIDVVKVQLETSRLNLARTEIKLPFRARISDVSVERTQFVGVGATLAGADGVDAAEVVAQIPQSRFGTFLRLTLPDGFTVASAGDRNAAKIFETLGWTAKIRLQNAGRVQQWDAQVVRSSDTIDPETRTFGAIVSVANPYDNIQPVVRPPLVKGMFVEVALLGPPLPDQIVVPRAAVHEGRAYVADAEDRLRIRNVEVKAVQDDRIVVANGLAAGDRLILSDVAPAVDGMLLRPIAADETPTVGAQTATRGGADADAEADVAAGSTGQ